MISMENKEFKLEVLRMVLETGSGRIIDDPLKRADKYLQWCNQEDKPNGPSKKDTSKVVEISGGPRKK
jgi:hypothetical protein|tara:strand:- start:521 stop:724 length:204 start_codon:yes stop_codon:yes gene_type:complete